MPRHELESKGSLHRVGSRFTLEQQYELNKLIVVRVAVFERNGETVEKNRSLVIQRKRQDCFELSILY